jgi:thymidylate synthase (FAD)
MYAELIEYMGDDLRVVDAARVSFNKQSEWDNVVEHGIDIDGAYEVDIKELNPRDQKLINYLAREGHWTPFSHVMITMRETVPIFVARQRFKHMVGFTYNEISRRYVDDTPEFYYPESWRKAADNKKQGSSEEAINLYDYYLFKNDDGSSYNDWTLGEEFKEFMERVEIMYNRMIEVGVAPEQARMVLPQSMYTSYFVTGSLAAWARAYKLRSDEHAQKEIRDLAAQWNEIIGGIPELKHSWGALTSD